MDKFVYRIFSDALKLLTSVPQIPPVKGSKKRILIFNWRDMKHVYTGGAEVYLYEVAKRLVQKGNTVTWFCGSDGMSATDEVMDGIQVVRRGGFYFVYIWAFLYYIFKFRGKYDVVIDCENGVPFFTPLYVKEKKFLVVFHVHQEIFRISLFKWMSQMASYIENNIMPRVYKNIHCITISDSAKKDMLELGLGAAGITVINPGVSRSEYVPGKKSIVPTILFVGRLKQYKSIQVLLHAAQLILKEMKEVQLIIAGDGEEKKRLMNITKNLGIAGSVTFSGKVSEKKKIELYQQAWIVVNPSVKEGWGITSLEANACGTPVIASNVSGLCDSIKDTYSGILVPYGKPEAFAKASLTLLRDSTLRDKMSLNAVEWAKKFSWEKTAASFVSMLQ